MHSLCKCLIALCSIVLISECNAARILAVFPLSSASHAAVLHAVTAELAQRGHELVVFDGYSMGDKLKSMKNYHEIHMKDHRFSTDHLRKHLIEKSHELQLLTTLPDISETLVNKTFANNEMKKLIANPNEHFDLVIIEWLMWDGLNALGYRFNAPVVGLMSVPISMFGFSLGLPFFSIDKPNYVLGEIHHKTFFQRTFEFVIDFGLTVFHQTSLHRQQRLVEQYFGSDYPHVSELMKNVSMIFTTQDPVMPHPTLSGPNIINMGGLHVAKSTDQQLPPDLKEFLDSAKEGVVYFSFGSTLPGKLMLDETKKVLLEAFAEIPYRVVWKWEDDELPGKSNNVFISKWLPQRAVLAHPATKVFIYQGGLQSTEEAIAAGVPLVGIPLFGDQPYNVNKMVNVGAAVQLNVYTLDKDILKKTIVEVVENKVYKERMIAFRNLLNDRPYDPLNNTMWWIEYVIRHKGAHHLKLERAKLPWFQAQNFDVIGFCYAIVFLLVIITYKIVKWIFCRCCWRSKRSNEKLKKS